MKFFVVKAYADADCGLKEQTAVIKAENREEAMRIAWKMFPEYHQVGAFEQGVNI